MLKLIYPVILCLFSAALYACSPDSVGTKVDTLGRIMILHKVEQGEGFYAIAKRYKVDVKKILETNPRQSLFLDVGEIIKVPTGKTISVNNKNDSKTQGGEKKHMVAKGENLYQISRQYSVSVGELKLWNNMQSNNLSVGQELIIKASGSEQPENMNEPDTKHVSKYIKEINESGMAGWIDSKDIDPKKSLALHKSAAPGTIIKVTNRMNNKSVYVKVIGALPETAENENLLILISKTAKELIGVRDSRFQCELTYASQ